MRTVISVVMMLAASGSLAQTAQDSAESASPQTADEIRAECNVNLGGAIQSAGNHLKNFGNSQKQILDLKKEFAKEQAELQKKLDAANKELADVKAKAVAPKPSPNP